MIHLKGVGVGLATGLGAAVLWVGIAFLPLLAAIIGSRFGSGGGGGIAGVSFSLELVMFVGAVGFCLGFAWTLRKARPKRQAQL